MVDVKVNGTTLRLKVDTGADITALTARAAQRAGIRLGAKDPVIILSGASQDFYGSLTRTSVQVGKHPEKEVMVVVAPGLQVGRVDGLLGMSYLERFRMSVGDELELTPIDDGAKDRRGGRGERWWRLIFRKVKTRRALYERALGAAKKVDAEIEAQFGRSLSGENLESYIRKLRDFMRDYEHRLQNQASRFSVPRPWRGGR